MKALPTPRGPISETLFQTLTGDPAAAGTLPATVDRPSSPLAAEDLQLALYCCYELHYGGLPGVDDRWEWDPRLLTLRAALEDVFEQALLELLGPPHETAAPDEMDLALRAIADADETPSLSRYMQREATREQFEEFLTHRSAYQLKEADPHSWALPRLAGPPKAALVEIQVDEYGGGRAERIHATLFANSMRALGLDAAPNAYLDAIPGVTLATVNLMSLFGLHRRRRGAIVGHLALFEMTSSVPNRRYAEGLRRLGCGEQRPPSSTSTSRPTPCTRTSPRSISPAASPDSSRSWQPTCSGARGRWRRSTPAGRSRSSTPGRTAAARCSPWAPSHVPSSPPRPRAAGRDRSARGSASACASRRRTA